MANVKVTREVGEHLVLLILRDLGIPAGGRVLKDTLTQEWQRTGLRDSDMASGVQSLKNKGMLRDFDFETLELTPAGHKRMFSLRLSSLGTALSAKRALAALGKREQDDTDAPYEPGASDDRRS